MKASVEAQLKLLDLQTVDMQLARLRHELNSHHLLRQLAGLKEQAGGAQRAVVAKQSELSDQQREAQKLVEELEKLVHRRTIQQERLDSGKVLMRDMGALEQEIRRIRERETELENQQVEIEESVEACETQLELLREQIKDLEGQVAQLQVTLEAEQGDIAQQIAEVEGHREQLRAEVEADLLAEYDRLGEKLGTLVVLEVRDGFPVDSPIQFSEAELQELALAAADEVLFSEEGGYLVVRTRARTNS